jgi:cysteine desulfurase family protein
LIYFDQAATSRPKPERVIRAMARFLAESCASPGRSGHALSIAVAREVFRAREAIAGLFGAPDPIGVVFTANATTAINIALWGLLGRGDHVVTSSIEHNAVMRPLRALASNGVGITAVPCDREGRLDPAEVERALRPETRLVVVSHASNVLGTILPVEEIGARVRRHGALFLVDAAQTAGALPIDVGVAAVDLLAFTGHKSLCGPPGTGGLVLGPRAQPLVRAFLRGGTGSLSESEDQPDFLPDRLESGTPNTVGIAGLLAAIEPLDSETLADRRRREVALVRALLDGLRAMPHVVVHGPAEAEARVATVSFNVAGRPPDDVAVALEEDAGICCRPGLHCAPAAHRTMGTFPGGSVRFGLGEGNTLAEVAEALAAVGRLVPRGRPGGSGT